MSGTMNINKIRHTGMTLALDAKDADYITIANITAIKCDGFNKLFVQYVISTTSWDRAGDILIHGAFSPTGTFTALDDTIENAKFSVGTTDDNKVGAGEIYIVENIPPWIKVTWDNTTAGGTGTTSLWVMPFNA